MQEKQADREWKEDGEKVKKKKKVYGSSGLEKACLLDAYAVDVKISLPTQPAGKALTLCCRTVASRQPPDISLRFASDAAGAASLRSTPFPGAATSGRCMRQG